MYNIPTSDTPAPTHSFSPIRAFQWDSWEFITIISLANLSPFIFRLLFPFVGISHFRASLQSDKYCRTLIFILKIG